jgi:hypothetical protein
MRREHGSICGLSLFAALVVLAWVATTAHADRPIAAGSTAGICDVLSDATSSLESLCVNYCVLHDCVNSDDPECDNLLANYDRHREDGDPDMPCLATCPCFTAEELRNFQIELTWCIRESSSRFLFSAIMGEIESIGAAAASRLDIERYDCGYSDPTVAVIRFGGFALDSKEAAVCHALVDAAIAERGLTCRSLY